MLEARRGSSLWIRSLLSPGPLIRESQTGRPNQLTATPPPVGEENKKSSRQGARKPANVTVSPLEGLVISSIKCLRRSGGTVCAEEPLRWLLFIFHSFHKVVPNLRSAACVTCIV